MVQPFDVAWQRTDGLDLRDDALLRDSKQDAGRGEFGPHGAAGRARRTARAVALRAPCASALIFSCTSVPGSAIVESLASSDDSP